MGGRKSVELSHINYTEILKQCLAAVSSPPLPSQLPDFKPRISGLRVFWLRPGHLLLQRPGQFPPGVLLRHRGRPQCRAGGGRRVRQWRQAGAARAGDRPGPGAGGETKRLRRENSGQE